MYVCLSVFVCLYLCLVAATAFMLLSILRLLAIDGVLKTSFSLVEMLQLKKGTNLLLMTREGSHRGGSNRNSNPVMTLSAGPVSKGLF